METKKQRSVVYMADRGWKTLSPQINAGMALMVPVLPDVLGWLQHAVRGEILDKAGKWVKAPDDIGLWAFESATSIGAEVNRQIRESHSTGVTRTGDDGKTKTMGIGPAANTYKVGVGTDVQSKATLDKGHFGIMQNELRDAMWQSQDLPGIVLWTALALRKTDDDLKIGEVIGPELIGKALTGAAASWFHLCLHADSKVEGNVERHVLYLGGHSDLTTGNARVFGNPRVPFGAEALTPQELVIEPASLVKAISMLERKSATAADAMKKKYGLP